ncbi:glycosyltransferase family 4 protein [Candidatus Nanohalobium constans]|uniref:Glycosyl transferase group 1 n=1 Tax=Candidatus Nanohalobium constans TaxID=2565781 RepID=A0A5Q0UEN9_9ARCH|nr:glycosyltransferase family 4 protein [Candidatus Nanohalobium constans]QGA80042.1 glycosyl transferase group 1 [Candidatus Nanohalobium constans]
MNKKILLLGWGYPPNIDGGLDIHVKHLFEELQKRDDVEVKLALPQDRAPEKENIVGLDVGEGDMVWKAREMSSQVAELADDFDIIHTHDWFGAEAGFKAQKYSDCSWVSTIHSLASGRSREHHDGEVTDLEKLAVEKPGKAIAVSNKLAEEVESEHGEKPKVIYNGFSKPQGKGQDIKEKLDIEDNMVFFVGRHAEQKGIEHLIYGFKKFLKNGGEATLVIGGDGEMRESLEKFAEMLDIHENTIFTGFIPTEELGDYYKCADLFVSPSINEPFGLTISEALESGTPVLATENGVSEFISGDSIIEIDPDSDSIAEGLKKGLRQDIVVDEESRSWGEMTDEIIEIYRNL